MKIKKKVLVDRNTEGFLNWMFIRLLTMTEKKHGVSVMTEIKGWERFGEKDEFEICLTIDGVEVPFIEAVESLEKQYDQQLEKRAAEIVVERLQDSFEVLQDLTDEVKKTFIKRLKINDSQ